MKAEHIFYSLLIFSVVFLGGLYAIVDFSTFYNGAILNSDIVENNNIERLKNISDRMKNDTVTSQTGDLSDFDFWRQAKKAYERLKGTVDIASDILGSLTSIIGIPQYIVDVVIVAMMISILMSLIYLMVGWFRS